MMSDICGRDVVDRPPVVLTRYEIDQLLFAPITASATGENMPTAVYNAIEDWRVSENINPSALIPPAATLD